MNVSLRRNKLASERVVSPLLYQLSYLATRQSAHYKRSPKRDKAVGGEILMGYARESGKRRDRCARRARSAGVMARVNLMLAGY